MIVFIVFISSLIYPFTIYDLFNSFIQSSPNPLTQIELAEKRKALILWLSIYQFAFCSIIFIVSIFISHKIAGPIFKLTSFLRKVASGINPGKLFFRDGDHFMELADDYNEAMETVRDSHNADFAYIAEVNSYINNLALVVPEDKRPVLEEIVQKLTEIQDRFKE
ncbi:MAG: hypothetical protein ACOYL6_04065 [Bacteriovoracaceae bacterium]